MKYLIVVFLFTSLNTLDAQNLNFRIEGGTSLIGRSRRIYIKGRKIPIILMSQILD